MSGTAARKVVVYGASGCGKTSLMRRWSDGEFSSNETPTLGVNVVIRNGTQVWDTSGQDRFHALSLTYLTGAHAVLFVYSIGNYASFEQLKRYWIPLVLKAGMPGLALYMVGAKQDLEEQDVINGGLREVSVQDAVELAASYDLHYGEASAKNGHGLDHIKLFLEDHQQPQSELQTLDVAPEEKLLELEPFAKRSLLFTWCCGGGAGRRRARKYSELQP